MRGGVSSVSGWASGVRLRSRAPTLDTLKRKAARVGLRRRQVFRGVRCEEPLAATAYLGLGCRVQGSGVSGV